MAALVACAFTYESLYGRGDLPMAGYLSRWMLAVGAPFVAAGILRGLAIHLLRERKAKDVKSEDFEI